MRSSVSDLAIYHQLRRAFVSVNDPWASSVRFGRFSSTCRLEEIESLADSRPLMFVARILIAPYSREEALAGSPLSTLSRAQDGSRIPKACVRLWRTPTHEGPDHRTAVLLDREERVPTRGGESRLGQLCSPITSYEAFARAEVNREHEFELRRFLMGTERAESFGLLGSDGKIKKFEVENVRFASVRTASHSISKQPGVLTRTLSIRNCW